MEKNNGVLRKTLYAILFLIVIPCCLWLWAWATEDVVTLSPVQAEYGGPILIILGSVLMLWAMDALWRYGNGLPMNAFPPEKLVHLGPYKLVQHPIYWAFGMIVVGISLKTGSSSGLWLISPVTILGMIALILGYEKLDLDSRFPGRKMNSVFSVPHSVDLTAAFKDHFSSVVMISLLLLTGNFLLLHLNTPETGYSVAYLAELLTGYSILHLLPPIFILITAFVIKRQDQLRLWVISTLIALGLLFFFAFLFPKTCMTYFTTQSIPDLWEYLTTPLLVTIICTYSLFRKADLMGLISGIAGLLIISIQILLSSALISHLIISIVFAAMGILHRPIWNKLRELSEMIANSWREWKIGPVRVINHGFYVGLGSFLGIFMAGYMAGVIYAWALLVFSITVIIFSALWAQIIEGSEKLKRPFGYYGALVGIVFASLIVRFMGADAWVIIAVVSVFMPWVQATGRLRCLVNGCCHGMKTHDPATGIRYFHHRSRVCGISDMKGELLHPTPLYAIIWLFFCGFVLLSLWLNNNTPSLIFGIYLILTGIGRFAEEAYRGEVQTKILYGLRLYQWTAIASVIAGIIMTVIPTDPILLEPQYGSQVLYSALLGGFFTFFAMGVDFPYSSRRFSRLV
ncbi:prolipoprotein diacylglyceryl transferase family protein [Balneola sp. MJW-20]|uniref:prolipoprotein diacylglyceryl transferase family protein n=1 Tax=Gracilimonas aurantiaca TaxID=3234185 RepID=UPI003465551E